MPVFEPFSVRQRNRERQGQPVVYRYDDLPVRFRVQAIQTLDRAIGAVGLGAGVVTRHALNEAATPGSVWRVIHDEVAGEAGVFNLSAGEPTHRDRFASYLQSSARSADEVLDAIEMSFRVVERLGDPAAWYVAEYGVVLTPGQAIEALNHRFRQHDLGYQFAGGELIRVDSQFIHAEVVEPAIALLHDAGFEGATSEFLSAHRHYRRGEARAAMAEALNAFESTMKAICDSCGWSYPPNATAAPLIDILIENRLMPAELESHYKGLVSAMKSGLPTVSNKSSRHGHGTNRVEIPGYLASHAVHLAAANIVFLIEAWRALEYQRS